MSKNDRFDFRSGNSLTELSKQINVFDDFDRHEFDDVMAMEVHSMKEYIFSIIGEVQKLDTRLPVANEYLLLSGCTRDGTLDIEPDKNCEFTRGNDYDLDYTLLVPVLKFHDRNQPVVLDMRHSTPCHSWLSLRLFDDEALSKWEACCSKVEQEEEVNHYLSPPKVCHWFSESVIQVSKNMKDDKQKGYPVIIDVRQSGVVTTILLAFGGTRILYDLVPVVSFHGWPAVAMGWLSDSHYWDGIVPEEEVIKGFHLVPACSIVGKEEFEWRLSFARSEVQLKRYIPEAFMKTFYAFKAVMNRALGRHMDYIKPYVLRGLLLWACDRVKLVSLSDEDNLGEMMLGLIDDVLQCLLSRSCPNYFIPQYSMIAHLDDATVIKLCQVVLMVRSDPLEHVRNAVDQVKAARETTKVYRLQNKRRRTNEITGKVQAKGQMEVNSRQEMDLAEKMRKLVNENPGKSISVFLNPNDVTNPHFRIDGKFY